MKKIIITATAESVEQVKELLEAGVDRIYVGEKEYGLRLPHTFSYDELRQIAALVHEADKKLTVAVNALMHQEMMNKIKPFLDFFSGYSGGLYYCGRCRCLLCVKTRWLSV